MILPTNYRQVYAMKAEREKRIKKICPDIPNTSGIYAFYRVDEAGIKRCYVGQAKHLLERCASHLAEYDHIALSLKKHKFYSEDNPYGWKLSFKTCKEAEMDEKEVDTIKNFADAGHQIYNVMAGSQSKGKIATGQYKQPKTYRQGIQVGYIKASKEISNLFEKYLNYSTKDKVPNRYQLNALDKFQAFLDFHKQEQDKTE